MNHVYRELRPFTLVMLSFIFLVFAVGVVSADNAPWNCPDCGRTGNTGNFCGGCGHPAPWKEAETEMPARESAGIPENVEAGSVVTYGTYPQTAEGTDQTPIEWLVLDVQDGKALVISKYGLDAKPYNMEWRDVTWKTCTLRAWLNGEFLNTAFTVKEQSAILLTDVDNSDGQGFDWTTVGAKVKTSGGKNTQDKIFLLSCVEANKYFGVQHYSVSGSDQNTASRVAPTAYAIKAGAATTSGGNKTADGVAAGWWWLRSPGSPRSDAADVNFGGSLSDRNVSSADVCVRPAFWLDLESDI